MARLRQSEQQMVEANGSQPLVVVEEDVLHFVADHCARHPEGKGAWNGRQIRNAFVVAAGIARHEAQQQQSPDFQPQLRYSHFKQVEKLFDDYIQFRLRVLGKDDAQQALLNEERDDDFEGGTEEETKRKSKKLQNHWPYATDMEAAEQQAAQTFAAAPIHGHFINRTAVQEQTLQSPVMGVNIGVPPYNYQPQSGVNWGADPGATYQRYPGMMPGMTLGTAKGTERGPFIPMSNDTAGDTRVVGHPPNSSQSPLMVNGQPIQVSGMGQNAGAIGQDTRHQGA